jgi:hypothetical protein
MWRKRDFVLRFYIGRKPPQAAHSGQDALVREAQVRPVTLFLAALAAGFILGRAL